MSVSDNLSREMRRAKVSQYALERLSGVPQPTIQRIIKGSDPKASTIKKIAEALHISPSAILDDDFAITRTGKYPENMLELSKSEHELFMGEHPELYGSEFIASNIVEGPESKGQVPLISWVQAGDWCEAVDLFEVGDAEKWLPCPVTHSDKTFILRVQGTSMEPEYRDGDLIFVDPSVQPEHNSDIVVRLEDANTATFKRLQIVGDKHYISPINKDWPEPVIPITELAQICGVVIFSGRLR